VGFLLSVFLLALSPHHLSGLLSQPASWPLSTLVDIWNWTPPTAGSWRSQWGCYENWSLPSVLLLKVSAPTCWCCGRSLNTGAAGVEGILSLLFKALKNHVSRFCLSCWILGVWVFSFSSSLMWNRLRNLIVGSCRTKIGLCSCSTLSRFLSMWSM
jgi:hypothetical protein